MRHLIMVLAASVMVASCGSATVRDETVYRTELDFMEQAAEQPSKKLVVWIGLYCACRNGEWVGAQATKCAKDAKLVQVLRARVPWHKKMMLYNGGLLETQPPKDPPKVKDSILLCPGGPPS